ncbi:MAG: TIGR04086 family membrane protein [Lachnospiraceae bacterium]
MKAISFLKVLLLTYVFTGLLLLLLSLGLYKLGMNEQQVGIGIFVIYFLSGFFGGFLMGKSSGKNKFLWGLLLGVLYFAVLTAVSLGVNHSFSGSAAAVLAVFALCAAGGTLGGMVS